MGGKTTNRKAKTKTISDVDDCIKGEKKTGDMLAIDLGRDVVDRTVRDVFSEMLHLR